MRRLTSSVASECERRPPTAPAAPVFVPRVGLRAASTRVLPLQAQREGMIVAMEEKTNLGL
jgi:hypothetical protein